MKRLLIVSNRLPFSVKKINGKWQMQRIVSGLISGLEDLRSKFSESRWIGWEGNKDVSTKTNDDIKNQIQSDGFIRINLSTDIIEKAYDGFCKKELWAIFHGFPSYSRFIKDEWESFVEMNQYFTDEIIKNYQLGDIVYIHDFQLMLIPGMLKKQNPNIKVGFFLHIPFPSPEIFKLIPPYQDLIESISKSDYIGFHTSLFAENYKKLCEELEYSTDNIDINPIGIDKNKLVVDENLARFIKNKIGTKIILGCERADFAKGIIERLKAYELLLEIYPDIREKVTLIQVAVGSTKGTLDYERVGKDIQLLVAEINGKYSTITWNPIIYINRGLSSKDLYNLYSISDICSINSLVDGLNLTSFEYVLTPSSETRDLILSEFAGASTILKNSHIVNPRDISRLADLFYKLLLNPTGNTNDLYEQANSLTIDKWANKFKEIIDN